LDSYSVGIIFCNRGKYKSGERKFSPERTKNMSVKIYIDGQEGTTGLKILERFEGRNDIELIRISEEKRKDPAERARLINMSDYTFLCLPDDAAREAVSFVDNDRVRIIDASTAHRTNPEWAYGFPELSAEHREKIASSKRVAVPGCYASGFASIVYPLVKNNIIPDDFPIFAYATSGYSGAGKKAIAVYEGSEKPEEFNSPRQYALSQQHKHLPEMKAVSGLKFTPMFNPIVCDYFSGMVVSVPIQTRMLGNSVTAKAVHEMYAKHYEGAKMVEVMPLMSADEQKSFFLASNTLSGLNKMQVFVFGNDEQILLCSRLDNLGKGASGAAVQCLNIMMGIDETTGLV
jgi:N-acetyl-gamma-glutamyl-phosphate reductase